MNASVVIPTCDRPRELARCLQALDGVSEVIVTDDSRGDETRDLLRREFPRVRWVRGPGRGPAANRNHGARQSTAEWLVFVDDDCIPASGWFAAVARAAVVPGRAVIEGRTVCPGKRDTPFEEHVENLTGGVLWSCNFAIRRAVFERLGGFDEDFPVAGGEDMEFAWRVRRAGLQVVFEPAALVWHPPRAITVRDLWKRLWRMKWSVLFRLKTGVASPLWRDAPLDLLRLTWRTLLGRNATAWRAPLFLLGWRWATFPIEYPYLLWWERRFRKMLKARER